MKISLAFFRAQTSVLLPNRVPEIVFFCLI